MRADLVLLYYPSIEIHQLLPPPLLENLHPQGGGINVVVGLQNFYPPLLKKLGAFGADYDDNYNRLLTHNHASAAGEHFELLASGNDDFLLDFQRKKIFSIRRRHWPKPLTPFTTPC